MREQLFTVSDVYRAGYTLEPLRCLNPKCAEPESGNVTYNQQMADAYCSICGEDQFQFVETNHA